MRSASSAVASASSSSVSGCEATTSSASIVRASASTGFAEIRRSGRSTRPSSEQILSSSAREILIGANGAAWEMRDLALLAQLEQGEERNRLLDAREALHLGVEVEPAAALRAGRGIARRTAPRAGTGGPCARARRAAARRPARASPRRAVSGSCCASRRSGSGASGAGPMRKKRSRSLLEPLAQPAGGVLHAAVLGEPPASSSAASSGSSSASSASSSGNR